jgi:hypothetical protein
MERGKLIDFVEAKHRMTISPNDPVFLLATISEVLNAEYVEQAAAVAERVENAATRIEAVKAPIADKDLRRLEDAAIAGAANGANRNVVEMVRAANWRTVVIGILGVAALCLASAAGGYKLHSDAPVFAGIRAGLDKCEDQVDGSRVCWIPVYERAPRGR